MNSRSRFTLVAIVLGGLVGGCTPGPDGTSGLQPLVFPWEGQLGAGTNAGTTVAIVVDSNHIDFGDNLELYDLHRNRVTVDVTDPLGVFPDVAAPVRSVFSLQATPNSNRHKVRPGSWATVVVVDLPGAQAIGDPTAFPFTVQLRIEVDGQADFEPRFVVTGKAGIPNPLIGASFMSATQAQSALEPRPTLRLRPKRLAGSFQPGQPAYGGMEFNVAYLNNCIASVEAYPGSEASNATAAIGPVQGFGFGYAVVKAVIVDPKGFNLTFMTDVPPGETTDETLAGEGPLVDIAVNWKATTDPACRLSNPALILLQSLTVSDVNGNQVFSAPGNLTVDTAAAPAANAVFRTYAVDLPPPAPSGGC